MANFHADIHVTLKPLVNDPEGLVIRDALHSLGFSGVEGVRAGKYLQVELQGSDAGEVETRVREMCEKLLANPVIEEYSCQVREKVAG